MNMRKLWRPALFFSAIILSMYGGFRSMFLLIVATLGLMFFLEGLHRTQMLPVAFLGLFLCAGVVFTMSEHLPRTFQRCIAFLPVKISDAAKESAVTSSDWRIEIWESVIPQIPKYLWLGKGLGIDLQDLASYYQLGNQQVGGEVGGGLTASGDYHNGPLSLIIQFGIWGVIAFFWFLGASVKVLWANYKYGDPDARHINTFLLAHFIAKIVIFFFVFGGFYSDVMTFTGIIGLSVSLNGGVAKKPAPVARPKVEFNRFRPLPAPAPTA
jgi:hypothetical protein